MGWFGRRTANMLGIRNPRSPFGLLVVVLIPLPVALVATSNRGFWTSLAVCVAVMIVWVPVAVGIEKAVRAMRRDS